MKNDFSTPGQSRLPEGRSVGFLDPKGNGGPSGLSHGNPKESAPWCGASRGHAAAAPLCSAEADVVKR